MACETRLKPRQTISERATEVREAMVRLAAGRVKVTLGPNGVPMFTGWEGASRDGITDACAYRRIMASGSVTMQQAIAKAEIMAGRPVNKAAVAQGVHSHDGGATWHSHKG